MTDSTDNVIAFPIDPQAPQRLFDNQVTQSLLDRQIPLAHHPAILDRISPLLLLAVTAMQADLPVVLDAVHEMRAEDASVPLDRSRDLLGKFFMQAFAAIVDERIGREVAILMAEGERVHEL